MSKKNQSFKFTTSTGKVYIVPVKYKDLTTVSSIIRAMTKDGHSRGQIAKSTGIRYQHVRNVLITPLSK